MLGHSPNTVVALPFVVGSHGFNMVYFPYHSVVEYSLVPFVAKRIDPDGLNG